MSTATRKLTFEDAKLQARGHEIEILVHFGFPRDLLDGKHHSCPICKQGKDCFRLIDPQAGAVLCNKCFKVGNGDFINAVGKITGMHKAEALQAIANYLDADKASPQHAKPKATLRPRATYANERQAEIAVNIRGLTVEARHEYRNSHDELLAVVLRLIDGEGEKTFRPTMKLANGQWVVGTIEGLRPLYGLDKLAGSDLIIVCEGEQTASALCSLGFIAVTWMGGAPSVKHADWAELANSAGLETIAFLPDNDIVGREAMRSAIRIIRDLNPELNLKLVEVAVINEFGEGADAADFINDCNSDIETPRREILAAIDSSDLWQSDATLFNKPTSVDLIGIPDITVISGQTDEANSRRLWLQNQGRFGWCHSWKTFVNYDGRRWSRDESMQMAGMGREVYYRLFDELRNVAQNVGSDSLRSITSFIRKSGSAHGQAAMLELVKSQPGVPVMPNEFNRDPDAFNCENGTIDLRTGRILAHNPADNITQLAPVVFDPSATCPNWQAFIDLIFCGDAELIRYVQAAAGYSLTGSTEEHSLFFCYGKGSNGKSTFLNTLRDICGDYGLAAAKDLLLTNGTEQHPTAMTDLFGRRWVNCIEADEGKRLCESIVKLLTGGDAIRARGMRENYYEFQPTHKIWLSANHKPTVRGDDDGIWRRIKLIPFTHKFTEVQKDTKFPVKLRCEWSGILNWMLEGLSDWRTNQFVIPSAVALASTKYRTEQDRLADWFADRCLVSTSMKARGQTLYSDYYSWCGVSAMGSKTFYEKMGERFQKKISNGIWYIGIALNASRQEGQDFD
jgi:putative DNA primase/helicase